MARGCTAGLAVIVALALLISACSQKHEYPESVQRNFLSACYATSSGSFALCDCALEKVQEQLSLEEYLEWEIAALRGDREATMRMIAITADCVREAQD